jgi:hypothetical protein
MSNRVLVSRSGCGSSLGPAKDEVEDTDVESGKRKRSSKRCAGGVGDGINVAAEETSSATRARESLYGYEWSRGLGFTRQGLVLGGLVMMGWGRAQELLCEVFSSCGAVQSRAMQV